MNYYIQGSANRAEEIKAAFENKGYDTTGWKFNVEGGFYYSHDGRVDLACGNFLINLIKTHPDYKELKLPFKPKFKVGDWVVFNNSHNSIYQISEIRDFYYTLTHTHGGSMSLSFSQEWLIRPWSIADAKEGDILAADECYVIFKEIDGLNIKCYCTYHYIGFNPSFHIDTLQSKTAFRPATKEQHDLLFAKMREAGYTWNKENNELCKIIEPNFKVGDDIKTGSTIDTIVEVDYVTRSYSCKSGRTIWFENQDMWHLAPKPHYDIANFYAGMPVLVREYDTCVWQWVLYSHFNGVGLFFAAGKTWRQCIPFEGNEHLLGTTDMPDEMYINW